MAWVRSKCSGGRGGGTYLVCSVNFPLHGLQLIDAALCSKPQPRHHHVPKHGADASGFHAPRLHWAALADLVHGCKQLHIHLHRLDGGGCLLDIGFQLMAGNGAT